LSWRDIKIENIDAIEKCVAEFEITALRFFEELYEDEIIHYGAFKVKIYERQNMHSSSQGSGFTGFTNLRIKSPDGGYEGGIGFGATIEESLEETIRNFMSNLKKFKDEKKSGLNNEDLVLLAYDEF